MSVLIGGIEYVALTEDVRALRERLADAAKELERQSAESQAHLQAQRDAYCKVSDEHRVSLGQLELLREMNARQAGIIAEMRASLADRETLCDRLLKEKEEARRDRDHWFEALRSRCAAEANAPRAEPDKGFNWYAKQVTFTMAPVKTYPHVGFRTEADFTPDAVAWALTYGGQLCAEAGEVMAAIEKGLMRGKPEKLKTLKEELGDVLWEVFAIANHFEIEAQEIAEENIKKLRERHSTEFPTD